MGNLRIGQNVWIEQNGLDVRSFHCKGSCPLTDVRRSQREGQYPLPPGVTPIMGVEFSGTVHELGPAVTHLKVGDEVFGLAYGVSAGK